MFSRRGKSAVLCGLEVYGDPEFRQHTGEALALLERLPQFALIQTHLAAIRQGKRSGVTAWADRPVFTVGSPTWRHSSIWYAGAIAHDAYHAKLYRDAKKSRPRRKPCASAWSGKAAERACLIFQRQVLLDLQADEFLVDYIETHVQNPTYQGRSRGWGGWVDYRKRRW